MVFTYLKFHAANCEKAYGKLRKSMQQAVSNCIIAY